MAGRGRGRGKPSMSFSTEQLGFSKGEVLPPPVLQPPAKFPPLEYKPITFTITNEMSYLLELRRYYVAYMKDSPNYVKPVELKKDIERYSDQYQNIMCAKTSYEKRYEWTKLPAELKPSIHVQKGQIAKKQKIIDVEQKLQELEKKETDQHSETQEEEKVEEETEEKDVDELAENEEEEMDEEMDEGTDYLNNYFDNGEGYDDEDDNMDDGPTY